MYVENVDCIPRVLSAFPMWNGMKIQEDYKRSSNSIMGILRK
jgi:hypothetical protein